MAEKLIKAFENDSVTIIAASLALLEKKSASSSSNDKKSFSNNNNKKQSSDAEASGEPSTTSVLTQREVSSFSFRNHFNLIDFVLLGLHNVHHHQD